MVDQQPTTSTIAGFITGGASLSLAGPGDIPWDGVLCCKKIHGHHGHGGARLTCPMQAFFVCVQCIHSHSHCDITHTTSCNQSRIYKSLHASFNASRFTEVAWKQGSLSRWMFQWSQLWSLVRWAHACNDSLCRSVKLQCTVSFNIVCCVCVNERLDCSWARSHNGTIQQTMKHGWHRTEVLDPQPFGYIVMAVVALQSAEFPASTKGMSCTSMQRFKRHR